MRQLLSNSLFLYSTLSSFVNKTSSFRSPSSLLFRSMATFATQSRSVEVASDDALLAVVQQSSVLRHLPPSEKTTLFHSLHKPVYHYILTHYQQDKRDRQPYFVGISAPQGCGKTTLTSVLQEIFQSVHSLSVVSLSLDDFYLTGAEQDALAAKYADNPLLRYRGNAGTHDLDLLNSTFSALLNSSSLPISLPQYDKSLRGGRGDRSPVPIKVQAPVDIVLFEGWMLGFESKRETKTETARLREIHSGLPQINIFLADYLSLHLSFDLWLVFSVSDISVVYRWRAEAERRMTESGRKGMTESEVQDFVQRFLPAYRAYLPQVYRRGPQRREGTPVLEIKVDEQRKPIAILPLLEKKEDAQNVTDPQLPFRSRL